jgi:hypothetical protein
MDTLLKMRSRKNATNSTSLSSPLLTSSSRCNVTLSRPISNSLTDVMETTVVDEIVLPTRIVSGNKPPEPFIKIAPLESIDNIDPTQEVTSAITSDDIKFWSQIAKGNDPIAPPVSSSSASAPSVSVSSVYRL